MAEDASIKTCKAKRRSSSSGGIKAVIGGVGVDGLEVQGDQERHIARNRHHGCKRRCHPGCATLGQCGSGVLAFEGFYLGINGLEVQAVEVFQTVKRRVKLSQDGLARHGLARRTVDQVHHLGQDLVEDVGVGDLVGGLFERFKWLVHKVQRAAKHASSLRLFPRPDLIQRFLLVGIGFVGVIRHGCLLTWPSHHRPACAEPGPSLRCCRDARRCSRRAVRRVTSGCVCIPEEPGAWILTIAQCILPSRLVDHLRHCLCGVGGLEDKSVLGCERLSLGRFCGALAVSSSRPGPVDQAPELLF